jgi:hypothetical protein
MITVFLLAFNLLFAGSELPLSQKTSTFDVIAQSIPKCDKSWKIAEEHFRSEYIPVPQTSIAWTNGTDNVTAYIFLFREAKAAAVNLRSDKEDEPYAKLAGIGDEAYLWSPTTNSRYTQYVIRFRKAGVLVLMSSPTEELTRNSAKCINAAISRRKKS